MFNSNFAFISDLQYQVKALTARVRNFETGEKYIKMQAAFKAQLLEKDRKIKALTAELSVAHATIVTVRKNWLEIFDDLENERSKELLEKDRQIKTLEERALRAERQRDEALDKLTQKRRELYQVQINLEDEKGKNLKLRAQMNRNYENSSIPSSMKPNHKKIQNSREKTGRRPGAQAGHEGYGRKRHTPTSISSIPAPKKYADSPNYRLTGKIITKQIIKLRVNLDVDEYNTPEFRNIRTGRRVHADFPGGVRDDINYDGSIKGLAFLLNSRYCVAMDKVRDFLFELTGGELKLSKGMISGLCKEFSQKTQAGQKAIFSDLLLCPVMNTDFTSVRLAGRNAQVIVCATPAQVMFLAREHKGHEGVKGTPAEDYQGIIVHDHDKTFYSYGSGHQECLAHLLRYLKDSMENEPHLSWSRQMRRLVQEMIHYRNGMRTDAGMNPEKVKNYEGRFLDILTIAHKEYEYEPPSAYYKDGYNLFRRLRDYMDNHLLFLHNEMVPTNNNLSERLLRIFKRKQKQAMTFRSFDSIVYICDCLSMIETFHMQGKNLFQSVSSFFC